MRNLQIEEEITCPYCGEVISLLIDCSVDSQEYIEDCFVCCRPIRINASVDTYNQLTLDVYHENE